MWDKPQALNWLANFLYALAFVLFMYSTLFVVVHLPIFPLKEVRVEGQLAHVTREQMSLIVKRYLKGNFFTMDLVQARDAFRKLPWVRNVSVRRRWPDTLQVVVEEHQEMARWGNIALVNTHGEMFHAASDSDLPVFYGPGDAIAEVAQQFSIYRSLIAPTQMKIKELALNQRRAWRVVTDKGMVIELGREQTEARLARFVSVFADTLGKLSVQISYADLRYPNGFAVRKPKSMAAPKPVLILDKPKQVWATQQTGNKRRAT